MGNTASNKLGNNGGRFYDFLSQPVLIDCNFVVDSTNGNGLGIRSLKGAGVQNAFMHTAETPGYGANGVLNPNPAVGFALVQLQNGYSKYAGGFSGFVSPVTGSLLAINSSALTVGNPYIIGSVGNASAGTCTIACVADSSGSLASRWFQLFDSYGNTFIIWFYVTGVGGSAPVGVNGTLVQCTIDENDTNAEVATALSGVIGLLLAQQPGNLTAPSGVYSFTSSAASQTITAISTQTNPYGPLPGAPSDGLIATGFTFGVTKYSTNQECWNGVGLQSGVIPSVGASFIASAAGFTTGGGSTGEVYAPGISGIGSMEVVGNPNATFSPVPMGGSPNVGAWIMVQLLAPTSSSVTTLIPTAPTNGTVIGMSFIAEAKSILIQGE